MLIASSTDLGASGYDIHYGYGLINSKNFILQVLNKTSIFMSPINTEKNHIYSVIYNNSNTDMNVSCIYAEYESNKMYDCIIQPILIPPKQTYIFQTLFSNRKIKYMIWENLKSLKPLTVCRELNIQ